MQLMLDIAPLREATCVIVEHHYLHRGRTMAQLAYWILVDGAVAGVLLFAYPRMSATYQGHHPMRLLELARMWVDPRYQGQTVTDSKRRTHSRPLASQAIGQALRRIRRDWAAKYPHLPPVEAIVSWADREHHEGTIYRASNFVECGISGGAMHGSRLRNNGGHDQLNPDYRHEKTAFIYHWKR